LFEETSTPVSKPEEASHPVRRTTRSMAKQITIPSVSSFPKEEIDILTSPEQEDFYEATINETEELVTKTLKDLRKEVEARKEIVEKVTIYDLVSSLTKKVLVLKVGKLTK
jgi:hypothetical protein